MKTNPFCISYWLPKLQEINAAAKEPIILFPKTIIIKSAPPGLIEILEGETPDGYDFFYREIVEATAKIGLPCFLRSGVTSAKHYWKDTCYVENIDQLKSHICEIVEFCECADFPGLPYDIWAIREFLNLETAFAAFRGELPINKERRYFIESGKVICHHPYWPPDVFEKEESERANTLPENWREVLSSLNLETPEEIAYLTEKSELVSHHFDGAWSLDWAMTKEGSWYAIDMALAERSFHWPGCLQTFGMPKKGER